MRKSELSDLINLLIFFYFQELLVVLRIFDSYAYGLILILFFTFLKIVFNIILNLAKPF